MPYWHLPLLGGGNLGVGGGAGDRWMAGRATRHRSTLHVGGCRHTRHGEATPTPTPNLNPNPNPNQSPNPSPNPNPNPNPYPSPNPNQVGLHFETVVLEKQGGNPAFAFLKGGEGADYYEAQKESAMSAPPPPEICQAPTPPEICQAPPPPEVGQTYARRLLAAAARRRRRQAD